MDFVQDLSSINASVDNFTKQVSGIKPVDNSINLVNSYQESRYQDKGFYTKSTFTDMEVNALKILWKSPDATVLVKKKMFSSLMNYNQPEYMDAEEMLFLRASKRLFSNKCKQIAWLEQLTKINNFTNQTGKFYDLFLPIVISAIDGLTKIANGVSSESPIIGSLTQTKNYTDKLKEVLFYNGSNPYTTWISENTSMSSSLINQSFSRETGVMELTNFTSFNISTSLDLSGGNGSISFSDPYHYSRIYQEDIELAISDVINSEAGLNPLNSSAFNFSIQQVTGMIETLTGKLNFSRRGRNASTITINNYPNSKNKKIIAILDRTGTEIYFTLSNSSDILSTFSDVKVDNNFIKSKNNVNDALNNYELSLFESIIRNINNYISLTTNLRSYKLANNKENNFIRRKLYSNFLGKHIVQPNDPVFIYINSRSKDDTYLSNSITNSFDFTKVNSELQQDFNNLSNTFDGIFNPSSNRNIQLEKEVYASSDFPNYLWMMFRNYFIQDKAGVCVFAGLAQNPQSSYSNNKYSFSFGVTSNKKYFEMGQINFNPGVATDNGTILDPLTPYKTKFEQVSTNYGLNDLQLLPDNIARLGTGMLKFKAGPLTGKSATQNNLISDSSHPKINDGSLITDSVQANRIMYSPDGLVYKWKEGIGIAIQYGTSINNDPTKVGFPKITIDPFANQDGINAISLLVTGQPYDYVKFFKASLEGQEHKVQAYYQYLQTELSKRNLTWGNFQPYKIFNYNEEQSKQLVLGQLTIQESYSNISDKLKKLNDLQSLDLNTNLLTGTIDTNSINPSIESSKKTLISEIQQINNDIINQNKKTNLTMIGNDVNASAPLNDKEYSKLLRRKINEYTRRLSWKVRSNDDTNLFIIDDSFDKDADIQAFYKDLSGKLDMYSNTQTNVLGKIKIIQDVLNIETFFDSQGHLRVRTPQYNRMPSSVFQKMVKLKQENGIQLFPSFLLDMIGNKIQYLIKAIEVEEDYVRILCSILGYNTDDDASKFLASDESTSRFGSSLSFFISSEPTDVNNYSSVLSKLGDEIKDAANPTSKYDDTIHSLEVRVKADNIFSVTTKVNKIINFLNDSSKTIIPSSDTDTDTGDSISLYNPRIAKLTNNILHKTGRQFDVSSYINTINSGLFASTANQSINIIKITNEISDHVSNRQKNIKELYSSLKNASDTAKIESDPNLQARVMFQKTNNADIPEIFENIIEDENYDDLGANSGKRYIIKNEHILQYSVNEQEPRSTLICVTGAISNYQNLNTKTGDYFIGGGSGQVSAEAVDYDMWRMYGFKEASTISIPYLENPKSQCAPYAAMLLNKQRKEILSGSVTIVGNEFMQVGDVIYIEPENMLFYVHQVSHNFSWSGSFNTTLQLTYGHVPGEYIPSPYDIIGKVLYNNQYKDEITNFKEMSNANEISIGALANYIPSAAYYSEYNAKIEKVVETILEQSALFFNRSTIGDSNTVTIPKVKLRSYNVSGNASNTELKTFADNITNLLIGKYSTIKTKDSLKIALPEYDPTSDSQRQVDKTVQYEEVIIDNKNERRSPSNFALNMADAMTNITLNPVTSSNKIYDDGVENQSLAEANPQVENRNKNIVITNKSQLALMKYVIDVFISFESRDISPINKKTSANENTASKSVNTDLTNPWSSTDPTTGLINPWK
jgi:hypothetical protein